MTQLLSWTRRAGISPFTHQPWFPLVQTDARGRRFRNPTLEGMITWPTRDSAVSQPYIWIAAWLAPLKLVPRLWLVCSRELGASPTFIQAGNTLYSSIIVALQALTRGTVDFFPWEPQETCSLPHDSHWPYPMIPLALSHDSHWPNPMIPTGS